MGLYRGSDVLVPRHGMQIIATRTFVMAAINLTAESLSSKYDKGLTIRKSQRAGLQRRVFGRGLESSCIRVIETILIKE